MNGVLLLVLAGVIGLWVRSYFIVEVWERTNRGWEEIKISGGVISYHFWGSTDESENWRHKKWPYKGDRAGYGHRYGITFQDRSEDHYFDVSISFFVLA